MIPHPNHYRFTTMSCSTHSPNSSSPIIIEASITEANTPLERIMSMIPHVSKQDPTKSTAENLADAINSVEQKVSNVIGVKVKGKGKAKEVDEDTVKALPAESGETSGLYRSPSPGVSPYDAININPNSPRYVPKDIEDWQDKEDRLEREHRAAQGSFATKPFYKDAWEVSKLQQNCRSESCDPNDCPQVLFPLEGGGFASACTTAADLLSLEDLQLKTVIDMVKDAHALHPVPFPVSVESQDEQHRLSNRFISIYGHWPAAIIYVVNANMIGQPTGETFGHNDTPAAHRRTFEDCNIQIPDKTQFFDKTANIHVQYDQYKTGTMFEQVYMLLVLLSEYQFAYLYTQVLVHRYYDVAFHTAQVLINLMHLHPDYCTVQAYAYIIYDTAARLIQQGGDKYLEEVTHKAQNGILQPSPRALHCTKLEDCIEGLRFYFIQLTTNSKKISLDA